MLNSLKPTIGDSNMDLLEEAVENIELGIQEIPTGKYFIVLVTWVKPRYLGIFGALKVHASVTIRQAASIEEVKWIATNDPEYLEAGYKTRNILANQFTITKEGVTLY